MKNIITTTENLSLQMFRPVHGIYQHLTKSRRDEHHEGAQEYDDLSEGSRSRTEASEQIEPSMRAAQVPVAKQRGPSMKATQATVVKKTTQDAQRHAFKSVRPWSTDKDVDADTRTKQNSQSEQESSAREKTVQSRFEYIENDSTGTRIHKQDDIALPALEVKPLQSDLGGVDSRVNGEAHSVISSETQANIKTDEMHSAGRSSSMNGEERTAKEQQLPVNDTTDGIQDSKLQKVEHLREEVKRPSIPVNTFVVGVQRDDEQLVTRELIERDTVLERHQIDLEMADRVVLNKRTTSEEKPLSVNQAELYAVLDEKRSDNEADTSLVQAVSSKLQRVPKITVRDDEMNMTHSEKFEDQLTAIKSSLQSIRNEPTGNKPTDVGFNEMSLVKGADINEVPIQNVSAGLAATNEQLGLEIRNTELGSNHQVINPQVIFDDAALERTNNSVLSDTLETIDEKVDSALFQDRENIPQKVDLIEKVEQQIKREPFEIREVPQSKMNTAIAEQKKSESKAVISDERLVVQSNHSRVDSDTSSVQNESLSGAVVVNEDEYTGGAGATNANQKAPLASTQARLVSAGSKSFGAEQVSTVVSMDGFSASDPMVLEDVRPIIQQSVGSQTAPVIPVSEKSLSKSDVQKIFESLIRDAAEQNGLEV